MKKQETNNEPAETGAKSSERALIEAQAAQEAREAAERQFIGDILADDNSDYGQESIGASENDKPEKTSSIVSKNSRQDHIADQISESAAPDKSPNVNSPFVNQPFTKLSQNVNSLEEQEQWHPQISDVKPGSNFQLLSEDSDLEESCKQ